MSNWPQVPLGEVLTKSEEWTDINPTDTYREITVRLWGKGVTLRREANGSQIASSRRLLARAGQFILSRIDARNGAFGLVPKSLDGAVVSSDFPLFTPNRSRLLPSFLHWMSKTRSFVDICKAASEGTTNRVRLQEDRFLRMTLTLPPLSEQRRILARIEELAASVNEACNLRGETITELKALLQTVKREHLKPAANWQRPKLRNLAELRYGISEAISNATDPELGLPIIRMANLSLDGELDFSDLRYIPVSVEEEQQFSLRPGDLLLNWRSGSQQHVGKTALFDQDGTFLFASFLLRIRCNSQLVRPEFLKLSLNFMRAEGLFIDAQRFQVNTKLNASEFGEFVIDLPDLEDQRRIVAELGALQAQVDALRHLQIETAAELDALLPSVLDKAFKGEL